MNDGNQKVFVHPECREYGTGKKCVVIVDDDLGVAELARRYCDHANSFRFILCPNGKIALAVIENQPGVCLVVSDYHMDVLDGLELVKNLRLTHPSLPVVMMTSEESSLHSLKKNGACEVFLKPLDFATFRDMANQVLS